MGRIDFIERVDIFSEFYDAFSLSRDAVQSALGGDLNGMANKAQFIYPKLRFVKLNMQRYIFASQFLRDTDYVIDVPCGTGYGTVILASNGNEVLGLDIDADAIEEASDMYRFPNIEFGVADMMNDVLPRADFITCLDGLEHVSPGEALIERFVESLNDQGILVISVPINELAITGGESNPFHMEDYTPEKLEKLLSKYFDSVTLFGHDMYGSISGVTEAFDGITAICMG